MNILLAFEDPDLDSRHWDTLGEAVGFGISGLGLGFWVFSPLPSKDRARICR